MPIRGWCPLAQARPSQTHGYPQGTSNQNQPVILADHIMAGWKRTLDDIAWQLANGVGVHFGLGRDGSASQYASIFDAHWGNGVAGARWAGDHLGIDRYDRSNPRLAALEAEGRWIEGIGYVYLRNPAGGGSLLNMRSISFEHEGFPGDIWTPAMTAKSIAIKRWCIEELARAGMPMQVDPSILVTHSQIDGVNRPNCPGVTYPRQTIYDGIDDLAATATASEDDDMLTEHEKARLLDGASWAKSNRGGLPSTLLQGVTYDAAGSVIARQEAIYLLVWRTAGILGRKRVEPSIHGFQDWATYELFATVPGNPVVEIDEARLARLLVKYQGQLIPSLS